MARIINNKDSKRVISKHHAIGNKLKQTDELTEKYKQNIVSAVETLVIEEVLEILRGIPVSEISNHAKRIKIKALVDSNYKTLADIHTASRYNLSSINGISEDSAFTIKKITNDIVKKTQKEIKIKISSDNKNAYSSELIFALYVFINTENLIADGKRINFDNSEKIAEYIEDLRPATGSLKWMFASKYNKDKAVDVYYKLEDLLSGEYGKKTNDIFFEIETITDKSNSEAWEDFAINSVKYFTVLEDVAPGILGNSDLLYGLPEDLAREINDECIFPDGLLCTLRRYQEWGVKYILHQEKVLLGDEMGLGKTIQAIATMVSLKNTGATHFLVVCPASVVTNWCREVRKHSLLSVIKIHGQGRLAAVREWKERGGVAVTTYETTGIFNLDETFKYTLLVVDEAHYIKNSTAKRSINTINLSNSAQRLLFMTGTPIENNVDEMVNLINVLQPKIAKSVKGISYMASAPQFREKVAPVYYRRKREDVLTELPDLIETKEWCTMSNEEEKIYEETILNKSYMAVRRLSWNVDDVQKSSKAQRLLEIVEQAELENRKVIVFSFFLDTIKKVTDLLEGRCVNPINGSVSPQRRQDIIDEFEQSPSGTVLAAQIQSGGTGLNIQSASVVVICEPQFKPSIENQAISRAYRMGQTKDVLVYRLLCENTIDEKISKVLESKQAIFDAFADKSVAALQSVEVDEKAFGELIEEEIERIKQKNGFSKDTAN